MKKIFNLKENIICHVLIVDNLTKSYYDISSMKLFVFKKIKLKKLYYLFGEFLKEKEKTNILRNYVFNSDNAILDVFDNFAN